MATPTDNIDESDPGDDVQRRFRYQHGYGVILLAGSLRQELDYTAIWCEQHEDFLGEVSISLFDAFQIKTREPHLGLWKLSDEAVWKSIRKFAKLEGEYPASFRNYIFVSNNEHVNSQEQSLPLLLRAISLGTRPAWAETRLLRLAQQVEFSKESLLGMLLKLKCISGPGLDSFDPAICQTHLGTIESCRNFNAAKLADLRDGEILKIFRASSLATDDPSQHYVGLIPGSRTHPSLQAKRISVDGLRISIQELSANRARFPAMLGTMRVGNVSARMSVLAQKMSRGGLAERYEAMRRRTLSAEHRLLGEIGTPGTDSQQLLADLENIVLTQCDDAQLRASQSDEPYGERMLIDVQDRLQVLSARSPERVYGFDLDCLIGIAGLLCSECKVWWSSRFTLNQ